MQHDLTGVRGIAVLDEIDGLPGAQHGLASGHRHAEAGCRQHGLDVRGHVVGPLDAVVIARAPRRQPLQRLAQVAQHVGIGVLLDGERRRGVAHE